MPEMSGLEATEKIFQSVSSEHLPVAILALTADVFGATRDKCIKAGMKDVLTKPLQPDKLKEAIVTNYTKFSERR